MKIEPWLNTWGLKETIGYEYLYIYNEEGLSHTIPYPIYMLIYIWLSFIEMCV
jgi:hypothetical protein